MTSTLPHYRQDTLPTEKPPISGPKSFKKYEISSIFFNPLETRARKKKDSLKIKAIASPAKNAAHGNFTLMLLNPARY